MGLFKHNGLSRKLSKLFLFLFALLVIIANGFGQNPGNTSDASTISEIPNTASHYVLPGSEETLLMKVDLWGEVGRPGVYTIPINTSIISLISSAGGPTDYAKLREVKIVRAYPENGEPEIITVSIEQFMNTADATELPSLEPGDVIYIPENFRKYFSTSMGMIGSIAGIASTIVLLFWRIGR